MGKKEIAIKNDNTTITTEKPAYLKDQTSNRGSEEVGHDDLVIPRIEVVQSLSTVRKKTSSDYIEGIEEGMLYNSVTKETYGSQVTIVPVLFTKEWLVWRDRKLGGGFAGAYSTEIDAVAAINLLDNPSEWEAVLTHQHFCLVITDTGKLEEAVISMSKSKLKVSKKLNSLVRLNGGDRFSRAYIVSGVTDENSQGQEFYNLNVTNVGFVSEDVFRYAEQTYELIRSGAASADRSFDIDDDKEDAPF